MASVIEACAPDLFAYYRAFDRSLPQSRHFIELFRWRPYINLVADDRHDAPLWTANPLGNRLHWRRPQ